MTQHLFNLLRWVGGWNADSLSFTLNPKTRIQNQLSWIAPRLRWRRGGRHRRRSSQWSTTSGHSHREYAKPTVLLQGVRGTVLSSAIPDMGNVHQLLIIYKPATVLPPDNVGTWLRNPGPITPNIVGFIIRNPHKGPGFLNQAPTLPPNKGPKPWANLLRNPKPRIPLEAIVSELLHW